MIESKVYKCEVCGTTYANKEACRECEAFHRRLPAGAEEIITGARYLAKHNANNPFPDRLTVRFIDGHEALYEYRHPLGKAR